MIEDKASSKINQRYRYHQVHIKEEYIYKITFRTRYCHYVFMVVPFGLTNAPLTFSCLMNNVFKKYLDKFVVEFLDDIIVYSETREENK